MKSAIISVVLPGGKASIWRKPPVRNGRIYFGLDWIRTEFAKVGISLPENPEILIE